MPSVAPTSLPAGWRVSGRDWSVAYRRDEDGEGRLDATPPRLARTLRFRCYAVGIDVAGNVAGVLKVLLFLVARDGRPVALEALPAPWAPPEARKPPTRRRRPYPKPQFTLTPCQACVRAQMFAGPCWCETCDGTGVVFELAPLSPGDGRGVIEHRGH